MTNGIRQPQLSSWLEVKKQSLHEQHEAEGKKLSCDDADLQKAEIEAASIGRRHLAQIGCARAVFTSHA